MADSQDAFVRGLSRRKFLSMAALAGAGVVGGGAVLAGCGGGSSGGPGGGTGGGGGGGGGAVTWSNWANPGVTAGRVAKSPEGLDLPALLDRIEKEMGTAAPEVQWTMNICLAEIGIHFPKLRKRAIAIGEKLGIYRDYPVFQRMHIAIRPDLDQRNGEAARLNEHRRIAG